MEENTGEQEELESRSPENSKAGLRRIVKLLFTAFGIFAGVGGVLLSIFFYATTLSAVNGAQSALDVQLSTAQDALSDTEQALAAVEQGSARVPALASNLSVALSSMGTATGAAATSLNSLADSVSSLPVGIGDAGALREAARNLSNASVSFNASSRVAGELASDTATLGNQLSQVHADIVRAKNALAASRQAMASSFNSLRFSALILSLMFFLAFALLISCSLAAFL